MAGRATKCPLRGPHPSPRDSLADLRHLRAASLMMVVVMVMLVMMVMVMMAMMMVMVMMATKMKTMGRG